MPLQVIMEGLDHLREDKRESLRNAQKDKKKDRKRLKDYLAIKGRNKLLVHSMDESPKNLRVKEPRHECFHSYEV